MQRRQFIQGVGIATGLALSSSRPALAEDQHTKVTNAPGRGRRLDALFLDDVLLGSSYLGCGGGGGLKDARELIRADLENGLTFSLLDVSELGDDDWIASPYTLGTLAPITDEFQARLDQLGSVSEMPVLASFRALETYLGRTFAGVIVGEIGPLSTAEALSLGARLGVPSLDADTVGRATPEINQHSVRVAGHDITPAAGVTLLRDEVILKGVADPNREEEIFRALSEISRDVGVTDAAIPGSTARADNVLVQKSITLSASIGAAVRKARANGDDPVEAARLAGDGFLLFRGTVADSSWADRGGFLVGDVSIKGSGNYADSTLLLDYKNEHLVATRDGKVLATCPDLITMIDMESFEGIGNPDFEEGQQVSVLAFKCASLWRRPAGLAVFEPRYFGYPVDYVPVEARLSQSR